MSVTLDFLAVLREWPMLLKGVVWTLGLTAISAVIGVVAGVACAWARVHGALWLKWVVGAYVELIRNTPFIVQLFFVFFGLPSLGVKLTEGQAAFLAMVINLGAYSTEIIRAGIEATPKGQVEAALALAMTRAQIFVHVVLKPAFERIWPALVSQIVIVMLGSAVVSQISAPDLTFAGSFIHSRNFRAFEVYVVITVMYLVLALFVRQLLLGLGRWAFRRT